LSSRFYSLQGLFPEAKEVATSKKKPTTAGFKIKESINILVGTLSKCTPHYIRCIKPNEKKAANDFNNSLVLHQVKYLGLLENVRIRRAGYAYRQVYDKFFYRYRVVCPKTWSGWSGDMVSGTRTAA
jgi:myosin-1